MIHPIVSSSLALLAGRLEQECANDAIQWTSPLVRFVACEVPKADDKTSTQLTTLQTNFSKHLDYPALSSHFAISLAWFGWYPYHANSPSSHIDSLSSPVKTDIVHCRACQRRIGLWAFRPDSPETKGSISIENTSTQGKREFDVLREHLSWCPIRLERWWEGSPLLREKAGEGAGGKVEKGWVKVSEKMEKKPWRRL
jgi:hypothetical protein